VLEFYCE